MEYVKIVSEWRNDFIPRIKNRSGSRKQNFEYKDAVYKSSGYRTEYDEVLIEYLKFINNNPLKNNDYFKYVNSYRIGKKLDIKYFRHNQQKLQEYYKKIDKDEKYNPFNLSLYKSYVLYMMLKLNGVYKDEYDINFNVKVKENRAYSPLSSIPSVLRAELPFSIKEVDIYRAFPSFIDNELEIIDRKQDVYELIDKTKFNTIINSHNEIKGITLKALRNQLRPVYVDRVNEVITEDRFCNKGKMFRDLVKYEEKAINKLVSKNNLKNYVRLHDGVIVKEDLEVKVQKNKTIKFVVKPCNKPESLNVSIPFYKHNHKGDLTTSASLYAAFFIQECFIRGREDNNDKIIIFQDTNNVVSPFNYKTETVKFLKNEINEFDSTEIENRIAKEHNTCITQGLLLLDSKLIEYYTDNANSFGLPFKNGFFKLQLNENRIVQAEPQQLKYKDITNFFAPHPIQKHTFTNSEQLSEFECFLTMISTGQDPSITDLNTEDEKIFNQFCKMFGYLCHSYKNPGFNPCIILSDEGANDTNRKGGRGKTIIAKALAAIQPTLLKGGNEFNANYIHNFADLEDDKRLYIIDDVPAGFKYDDLYTNIVGSISCQRKGSAAVIIPFSKTPKFIVTTNWAVRYEQDDVSTKRRFMEFKLTDFFNEDNTPKQVFGHLLFDEWDQKEWNLFYNFAFRCVALYLSEGLQRIAYDKSEDNFKAIFNSDSVLEEFERIFELIKDNIDGFTVTNFLNCYKAYENPLKNENYFHHRNVKNYIEVYIKHKKLDIKYKLSDRKWTII
jgi:hypothetical protein